MLLFYLIPFPGIIAAIEFIGFLFGKRVCNKIIYAIAELGGMIILPYLYADFGGKNDCCGESAVFSPDHQLTMAVLIILCLCAYFYSTYRNSIAPPVVEIIINSLLLTGIALNIVIAFHVNDSTLVILGNVPIALFAILVLAKNQMALIHYANANEFIPKNIFGSIAWKILNLNPVIKYPVLLILCLPILVIITAVLLLFGQKPDSLVRAFTDTYKHGLSQWDYKCDNVQCGGHYLCSVAANGHKRFVKPQRLGIRNGKYIICNRQLLVSNAFEDLIQERFPIVHRIIRKQYNKVGKMIHHYYGIFNNKFIADLVYVLMKPLEWCFLLVLYCFDKKPENRIARQYLGSVTMK